MLLPNNRGKKQLRAAKSEVMTKTKKLRKFIHESVLLGLLTLFLVTTVVPALAQHRADSKMGQSTVDASILLDRGRTLYKAERFSQAAGVWEQVALGFARQGDEINQAWSLSYLSLAYQNLGEWEKAKTAITSSLNLLQRLNHKKKGDFAILAMALNTQGSLNIATGLAEAALNSWQQAASAYAKAGDEAGMLGSQINQAQAMQALGLYRRSHKTLAAVNEHLLAQPDSLLKAKALRSLGVTLQVVGDLRQSQEVLKQSLAITQRLGSPIDTSDTLFSLGNTKRDLQQPSAAIAYYQQAAAIATSLSVQIEAQLNQLSLYVEMQQRDLAIALLPQIESGLVNLPSSRMSVYAAVNFARSLSKLTLKGQSEGESSLRDRAARVLAHALQQAKSLGDPRAEAYALTQLGELYEQTEQWSDAENLTERSLLIAQGINASDIASRSSMQLGRILKQQGDMTGAIAAYNSAVNTLQSLRRDLVAINADVQFSFKESVEPVYRELVGLLLQSDPSQKNLKQAREVIEALQLAELDNFFREACLDAQPHQIDEIDKKAAVIYPIILPDRLEVILSLPGHPLRNYKTEVPQDRVETILRQMRQSLNPAFSKQERLRLYQQVYDWLIRPAESELATSGIKTLVFVLDGSLRNLPMAALYDGQQYLVEKYSLALTQGLQLLEPRSLDPSKLKAMMGGLSEARQGFNALPAVETEVGEISSEVSTRVLLNQEFTNINLQNALKSTPFSVLHLATHGQFSSNADDTFILTWDGRINVREFDELLRSRGQSSPTPVELLVLSACQTATGDNRAVLGLAGVAVRSGARSTLATLWAVQDESTAKFMVEFYKQLTQPGVTKAEALRKGMLVLLTDSQYEQPFYWAPFVLVGNWL